MKETSKKKELDFLKSLPSAQPKQLTLSFPNGCTSNQGSYNNYPMPHNPLKLEWLNFLKDISKTKNGDTLTLFLDCNYMSLKHIETLLKVVQLSNCSVKEVAMHNIDALLSYSLEPSLCVTSNKPDLLSSSLSNSEIFKSALSKSALSQSVMVSNSIFAQLVQEEQEVLAKSLPLLLEKALKVNLSDLPLGSSTCDFMFSILNNLKCSELAISASVHNAMDMSMIPDYLNFFISQNKHIAKLDISKICQTIGTDVLSEAVVLGCYDNPRIEVKYSDVMYSKNNIPFNFKYYFDLSEIRMEPIKEDFIKSLLQVAHKLATKLGFPKETIAHIMHDYVDPYHYMETTSMFQPDGQHITALLGLDHTTDIVADFS